MGGTITCETLVHIYQIVWCYIQQGSISDGNDVENYWLKSKVLNTGHISLLDVIFFLQSVTSYRKNCPHNLQIFIIIINLCLTDHKIDLLLVSGRLHF